MKSTRLMLALWILAFIATSATPQEKGKKAPEAAPKPAPAAAPIAAPLLIENTDLARMLDRDWTHMPIVRGPGGATALIVGDGYRSVLIVRTTPAGAETACVESEPQAKAFLSPPPPQQKVQQ